MSSYYGSSNYYGNNNDPSGGSGGGYAGGHHQQQQSSSQNPNQQQPQQQQPYYQPASDTGGYAAGGYNVQQWQTSSEHQQGYSQPQGAYGSQQQPQQQQQPSLSFWNPATVATVASLAGAASASSSNHAGQDAMLLDLAGKTLMHSSGSAARVLIPGFSTSMHMLRPYFAVDNRFILKKMQRMLFPFVFTNWSRQVCCVNMCVCVCEIVLVRACIILPLSHTRVCVVVLRFADNGVFRVSMDVYVHPCL